MNRSFLAKMVTLWFYLFLFLLLPSKGVLAQIDDASKKTGRDPRDLSIVCVAAENFTIACDYRHSASYKFRNIQVMLGSKSVALKDGDVRLFESGNQTVAIALLVDVSDPTRKTTVESKSRALVEHIANSSKASYSLGLYTFERDLKPLVPFTNRHTEIIDGAKSLKAEGVATELYRSTLSAVDLLSKQTATRKGLILISDGKSEDRAYGLTDVAELSKKVGVSILSIGISEKPSDSPFLQTLERLSEETFGEYVNASSASLPEPFKSSPLRFITGGGKISFKGSETYDPQTILVKFETIEGKTVELHSQVLFPDPRSLIEKLIDWCKLNWILALSILVLVVALIAVSIFLVRRWLRRRNLLRMSATLMQLGNHRHPHKLYKTAMRIGRGKDNDIVLTNSSVSLNHAEIHRRREGEYYLVDLASTNGVFVNGEKCSNVTLKSGDVIELGEVSLQFLTE